MPTCPQCGADIATDARYCATCGAVVAAPRPERRKVVTMVFSDLTGSTELGERHDPETVRRVLRRYFDEFSTIIGRHGGTVEKYVGDAVLAVFGIPSAHEDDALRAVRATVEMRAALESLNDELEPLYGVRLANHTGINTGEVVTGDPSAKTLITGDAANVAARLEQAAGPGEILLGNSTHALVRGSTESELLPPLELKGKSEPVTAWRLLAIRPEAERAGRRFETPLVGRKEELDILLAELDLAADEGRCRLATVVGAPGIGKSRLLLEVERRVAARTRVLRGRCLPYGEGITYWPLAEVVRAAASIGDEVSHDEARRHLEELVADQPDGALLAARVAAIVGLEGPAGPPEEAAWAARRLFEALAQDRPLVLEFDDLHWAEPAFLDMLDAVASSGRAPVLLLAAARPDALQDREPWSAPTILLDRLPPAEADELIGRLAAADDVPAESLARVRDVAEGNPLFVEEMIAMLREQPDDQALPPTIEALLTARIDGLAPNEQDLLVRASIVGQEISRAALLALVDDDADVDTTLEALADKDLLLPLATTYAEDAYRFRHILVRDAAYAAALKELRAELHERFARWLARTAGRRLAEFEEIVGYHLEQAYRLGVAIAPGDPAADAIAADAARALGDAGRRALARGDAHAAEGLLTRAADLAQSPVVRAEILTFLAEARLHSGNPLGAGAAAEEARAAAAGLDRAIELRAALRIAQVRLWTDPSANLGQVMKLAESAVEELEDLGDLWGAAEAALSLVNRDVMLAHNADLVRSAERARRLAHSVGHSRVEAEATNWLGAGIALGPMPLAEGIPRLEELLDAAQGPLAQASVMSTVALLDALAGQLEDARGTADHATAIYQDLGLGYWVQAVALVRTWIERLAGDRAAEEQAIRGAVTALQSFGDTGFLSTYAAELARTLAETGRLDEALEWVEVSRANTQELDLVSQISWRAVRAQVLTQLGELDEAVRLARHAVALGEDTDQPILRGHVLLVLATALHAAGREHHARAASERALEQLRIKGSDLVLEQARRQARAIAT